MKKDVPAVRIWPMSDKMEGFRGLSIEQVQQRYFLRAIPKKGKFQYRSAGLKAPAGTVVLFQFRARIIASAVFIRDEPFSTLRAGARGVLRFDPSSFRTFDPVDADNMRAAWPHFRSFGHVKQHLNPARYRAFERRLIHVRFTAASE
jgi:hypothetical protein